MQWPTCCCGAPRAVRLWLTVTDNCCLYQTTQEGYTSLHINMPPHCFPHLCAETRMEHFPLWTRLPWRCLPESPSVTYFLNQYVRWERQNWTSEDFDLMINAYQTSFSVEINLDEWKTINGTSVKHWTEMTHSTRSVRVAFTCWGGWDLLVRESHCWGPFTSLWWHFCLARALLYPITSMESRGSHRLSAVMDNTFHIRLWRP